MIVALVGAGDRPSASLRILANQLEQSVDDLHVHISDVDIRCQCQHDGPGPWRSHHIDRVATHLSDLNPMLLGAGCTLWNVDAILDLCDRVRRLRPGVTIALWGTEALARRDELAALQHVDEVLPHPVFASLLACIERRQRDATMKPTSRPPATTHPYQGRLDELVRLSRVFGSPVGIEPMWGGPLQIHLQRSCAFDLDRLGVDEAARWIQPLLRAGLTVRLVDPTLTADRDHLDALLRRLEEDPTDRLILEIPDAILDPELAQRLAALGLRRLEIELARLYSGELAAEQLHPCLLPLAQRLIPIKGMIVYGHPCMDHAALGRTVDQSLLAGIEDLELQRLLLPPGSALRRQAADYQLLFAGSPPYEVLCHGQTSAQDMLHNVRFAATYSLIKEPLKDTGILRALALNLDSASEVIEGFGESLATSGHDPLTRPPRVPVERLFADHLRIHHGIDLGVDWGQAKFRRSPGLSLRWLGDGRRLVSDDATGRIAHIGPGAVSLIDRFDHNETIQSVCERIVAQAPIQQRTKLRQDLQLTVQKLAAIGFLLPTSEDESNNSLTNQAPFTSLEEFDYHYRMLTDTGRVEAFNRAIQQVIRPGQLVVEVGTGTGILAVLAAKAGARVTAIEQYAVMEIARAVANRSGVADRIHFLQGRSDLLQLEERGDVLISEIIGNRILNEGLLEVTIDARQRLLKPDAQVIPQRIEILAELGFTKRFDHLDGEFARIGKQYAVDLEPVIQWFRDRLAGGRVLSEIGPHDEDFVTLTDETSVITLDLEQVRAPDFSTTVCVTAQQDGLANAVLLAFRLQLQPGIEISTSGMRHGLHWSKPFFMLGEPIHLRQGQTSRLRVSYQSLGEISVDLVE